MPDLLYCLGSAERDFANSQDSRRAESMERSHDPGLGPSESQEMSHDPDQIHTESKERSHDLDQIHTESEERSHDLDKEDTVNDMPEDNSLVDTEDPEQPAKG